MTQDIMKLVHAFAGAVCDYVASDYVSASHAAGLQARAEDAKAAVVAAIDALTKDAERLDHIQVTGSTVELVNFGQKPVQHSFRVGGLYKAINFDLRLAIDAAMKESK